MWFEITVIVLIILVLWIIGRLLMMFDLVHLPKKRMHTWRHVKHANQACYCSICEIMLTSSGFFCECCGACADTLCIQLADKALLCKAKYSENLSYNETTDEPLNVPQKHLWVKGNLPGNSVCMVCERDIDYHGKPGLYGYRCCWCQRAAHTNCFPRTVDDKICDFGQFKDFVIPPNNVFLKYRRTTRIAAIRPPENANWKPLIVVANLKSGDNTAADVIAICRSVLNPIQIFELSSSGPDEALNLITKLGKNRCRVCVCGGDGSVGWILTEIFKRQIEPLPEVCILPIGTGNDLARVLGWGAVPPAVLHPSELCEKIQKSDVVMLDRWLIDIENHSNRMVNRWLPHRKLNMYNYFSVGVDAQVTFNFHKARESPFYMLSSRLFNKILYLCFGTHQVVLPDCVGLEKKIELYLDDRKIDLPELQSVVCLNIDSWGAGVQLWEMSAENGDTRMQSISDGVLEVIGIISSFHMAQLQVGLNKPIRLGQARKVRIVMNDSFPVQADGEPWIQHPCEVNIAAQGQATMLKYSERHSI